MPFARRVHPFTSGAVALALIALALVTPAPTGPLIVYAVAIVVALTTGVGRAVWLALVAVAPLWVMLFISQALIGNAGEARVLAPWGGTLSQPGLQWTLAQGARLGAIITISIAYARAFDAHRFLQASIVRGWPFSYAFLIVATMDAADRFTEQARRIRESQRARGVRVRGTLMERMRAIPALVFPLILVSLTDADDHALALETRGLTMTGKRTAIDPPADPVVGRVLRWLLLLAVIAAIILRVRG